MIILDGNSEIGARHLPLLPMVSTVSKIRLPEKRDIYPPPLQKRMNEYGLGKPQKMLIS